MNEQLKEIALRAAKELRIAINDDEAIEFTERFLASLPKPAPVAKVEPWHPFGFRGRKALRIHTLPDQDVYEGQCLYAIPPIQSEPASEQKLAGLKVEPVAVGQHENLLSVRQSDLQVIESLQSRVAELEAENRFQRIGHEGAQQLLLEQGKQLADMTLERDILYDAEVAASFPEVKPEIVRLREQLAELEAENTEFQQFISTLQSSVSMQTTKIAKLEAENARLKTVPMKYRRMQFNAQLRDENMELRQQLAAAQEEATQYKDELEMTLRCSADLRQQLATSQLREVQLREALGFENESRIAMCYKPLVSTLEALSLPFNDTALRQMIEEKTKPLAEALKIALEMDIHHRNCKPWKDQCLQVLAAAEGKPV